jgi:hypothetical protein
VSRPRRGLALLAAAAAYLAAAWLVPPGFYDGFAPPPPYNWMSPPPQFRSGNQPPSSGHGTVKVDRDGRVEPGLVSTQDGQALISFVPGAFLPGPGNSPVTVDVRPVADYPRPVGLTFETNVYCVTSSSTIAPGQMVLVTLRFSSGVPAPANVYELPSGTGGRPGGGGSGASATWQRLESSSAAAPFMISARTAKLGCFAGGFPSSAVKSGGGGGFPVLPVIVAVVVVLVVLAGIPLLLLRRQA